MLVFVNTRIYTCTYCGLQINLLICVLECLFEPIRCASISLVLMIITFLNLYFPFGFGFDHVLFISCICLSCQNIKIYMDTSWVICLSCKSIYKDSIVFKRYVCILIALTKHTYAMKYNFIDFHVLKFCDFKIGTIKIFFVMDFHVFKIYDFKEYWALLLFSWCHVPHNTSNTHFFWYGLYG